MCVTIVSIVWSTFTVPGYPFVYQLARAKRWYDFVLLYFIFRNITNDKESVHRYLRTLAIGYSLVVLHVAKEFLLTDHARLYGVSQTNELSTFLAGYWGLCVLMWLERRSIKRLLGTTAIAFLALMGLVYTLSRGGYLAFVFGVVVLLTYLNRKLLVTTAITAACLFSIVGFGLLPEAAEKRIQSAYGVDVDGMFTLTDTAASRMALNRAAMEIIRDYPIAGTGWGCLFVGGRDRLIEAGTDGRHVIHNMYLRLFTELGLLGFVPFLLILWFSFLEGRRLYRIAPDGYFKYLAAVFLSCLAAFTIANIAGNRMFNGQTAGYFWIMGALVERSIAFMETTKASQETGESHVHVSSSLNSAVDTL
jgi:O-antigen ligase